MSNKVSSGKTIFKIACATGGAVLASGVGLPWLGAMAGACLPKVLESSLGFLVSAVEDDKKQEVLASLLQKPIEQLASLGIEFTGGRIDDFFKSHFEAKESELNFDLPRAVVKVWVEALNKMLRAERDNSTLGLKRDDEFEKTRTELLTFWRQKLRKAESDNDLLKEFFGEKPDYFLDIEKGKASLIDVLPDQKQVENFFWERIEESFTNWATIEEKFPEDWANSIHQSLKDELKQNLFHNFSSALKKELKENERAWKSFEFASSLQTVSMLQSLSANTDQIKDDTSNIKNDLAELNTVLPLIMRDILNRFDALENTVKEFFTSNQNINGLLVDFRKDVSEKLSEIGKDVSETKDYAKQAAENTEKLLNQSGGGEPSTVEEPKISDKSNDSVFPKEIEEKIKEGKIASRLGKYEAAYEIWSKIASWALETNNQKIVIQARLELAHIEVSEDIYDIDEALKTADECFKELKKVDLGDHYGRALQLIGEIHRIKGNKDQARGFIKASLDFSISKMNKHGEGWAYFALAMLSYENNEAIETQFDYLTKAYDAFTNLLMSDEKNSSENAKHGYALCHMLRAHFYGYARYENALAEYSSAIAIYREMGESWEFELAKLLLQRGEMQATRDDIKQALSDIVSASEIFIGLDNHYMEAKCLMACAQFLDNRGLRTDSEAYFRSALQKVDLISDERKKGWFYFRYAMKLLELGEHDNAKEILLMLLSNESIRDSQKLDVLKPLSQLAKFTKNENELVEYEEYSLLIIENLLAEATSTKERLRLLFNKGHTLEGLGKYELALETFHRTIRLAETMSDKNKVAECWSSIAKVNAEMKDPKEERKAYEQVLTIIGDDESSPQLVTTLTMLAQMEMKESNFNEANELLDRAEKLCKKVMPFLMFVINDIRKRLNEAESKK